MKVVQLSYQVIQNRDETPQQKRPSGDSPLVFHNITLNNNLSDPHTL